MARIIKRAEHVTGEPFYQLVYDMLLVKGTSYWFPCDAEGNLLPFPLASFSANMDRIKANPGEFAAPRIEEHFKRWVEPAVLQCDCEKEVVLDGDVQCECGQWYNVFGQKLNPPGKRGEEAEDE